METKTVLRPAAFKINIKDLQDSIFVEGGEGELSFNLFGGKKIVRINVMGTIVKKEIIGSLLNLLIDDGTGIIIIRFFEENKKTSNLNLGELVNVIGKLRKYQDEKYIYSEIIKKINSLWFKLRLKEIENSKKGSDQQEEFRTEIAEKQEESKKEKEEEFLPTEKIINLIKNLETEEGVSIEELIEKLNIENIEKTITQMLERGDIFQNKPGRVKVL